MSIHKQVSRAIRILRGNRDVSARASHLVVQQDRLMTYESVLVGQAEMEKFSKSTFSERKIMSTKTSIKRIAAVAAVALTLGGFSAVSANATVPSDFALFPTVTALSTPATATTGVSVSGTFNQSGVINAYGANSLYSQAYLVAIPATSALAPNSVTVANYSGTSYTATTGTTSTASNTGALAFDNNYNGAQKLTIATPLTSGTARINGYFTAAFTPDVAGTYVVAVKSLIDNTQVTTWTVTASAQTLNHVTAFLGASGSSEVTADSTSLTPSSAAGIASARLDVRQYSSTDTTTTMVSPAAVTVAISGAGSVDLQSSSSGANRGPSSTTSAGTADSAFTVWSDGRSGVATITVSVGGVVVATKTLTFVGSAAKYALAATQASTFATYTPKGGTSTLTIAATDANGNAATVGTIYAVSDNTAAATVTVSGSVVTVSGVAAGKANITVCDTASCTAAVKTLVVPVEVTLTTAASFKITTDALTYAPGQKITLTVAATDANGRPVADGALNLFSSTGLTSDVLVNSPTYPASAAVTLAAGVATFTAYAPISGSVTFSATQGSAVNAVAAGGTAAVVSAPTVTVANASVDAANAAQDAANEATDAANAATDAANNAMDSADAAQQAAMDAGDKADAALAAVTDLATKVSDIATQISSLSAVVAKIAAAVAKISAKVKA